MGELEYWRFKSKLAEIELEKIQLQIAMQDVNNRKSEIIKENGLNPNKNYRFDDKTFEVKEIDG
jgi:hypothetical protein